MFLKSIELLGFKSFADRSHVEFTEGISALLGPNGCGKSNIVDAIKWVLGEQSTKTLRAEKMEDVIFNGTESRKALSVAEVTLTLSNDHSVLSIDQPEISVKRRLYRSGESEYYLNNTSTKLRDLRELFYDTGIGKSAYSIMEQGKIDQILSNKPEDRRYIFEEAAGITKYKIRGADAERKLLRTEDNMKQVEHILREVKRSHDTLKNQAEKTNTYRSLRERIFENELHIHLLRLRDFLEDQEKKEDRLAAKTLDREATKEKIDNINQSLEVNLDQVNTMESNLIDKQKKLYRQELERNNCESQIQIQKERIEELKRHLAGRRERETTLKGLIDSLNKQIDERSGSLQELVARIEEIEGNIGSFEHNIESAQSRIGANDRSITQRHSQAEDLVGLVEKLQSDLRDLYDDIVTQLDTQLTTTGYSHQKRRAAEESLTSAVNAMVIHIEGRLNLVMDARNIASTSAAEKEKIIDSFAAFLEDAAARAKELERLVGEFRQAVPAFIDEFLAPEGIITKKREIDRDIEHNQERISTVRRQAAELQKENKHLQERIEEYRKTLEDLRVARVQMISQKAGIEETISLFISQRNDHENQLAESRREIKSSEKRLENIEENIEELGERKQQHEEDAARIQKELSDLEIGIADRNQQLLEKERNLKRYMLELEKLHGQTEKLQVDLASLRTEIRNVYENFNERHSRDLRDFQDRILEISTPIGEFRDRLTGVRAQLKNLGQVNLMAPEEYLEVKERYDFLSSQLEDLKKAREDLRFVTEQIRTESSELFVDTYDKIKKSFHVMFRRLFGGGRAELILTDPKNVLTSGIDIHAQPPGKKLESIDLLSGGEKSLTAVGLLFATYMVRPSPFCVLDEIDAALDEENVGRFTNLLKEFSNTSQFIIITHNKRTVAAAETLLGVTMEESGVSKAISVRIGAREEARV